MTLKNYNGPVDLDLINLGGSCHDDLNVLEGGGWFSLRLNTLYIYY